MIQEKAAQGAVGVFVSILNWAVSTVKHAVRLTEGPDQGECWWGSAALLLNLNLFTVQVTFTQNVQHFHT